MKKLALLPIFIVLAGCAVGPNYKRPAVNLPTAYRAPALAQSDDPAASLGNEKWWDVYQDPVLAQLIHTALQQNYDVRIAATRVLEAQAQLGITRANQFPSASIGAGVSSQQNAKVSSQFPAYEVNAGQLNLSVIWNLDFWGKYRRQTEEARAQLLATKWGQQAVISSLVANVATAYFQLRALDAELEIGKRTLGSRQQSLQLTRLLETHGSASDLDVSQSEQLVYTASETIPDLERQIEQQENALSILLGENPSSIPSSNLSRSNPRRIASPSACPPNCSSVGRMSARRKPTSWQPTPKSASLKPRSFPVSLLQGQAGSRVMRCTISSNNHLRPGTRPSALRSPSSKAERYARNSGSPERSGRKACSPTSRLF